LELAHLASDTTQAIEIARAQALGEALSNMDTHIFGDGATAQRLLQLISWSQGANQVYDALPDPAKNALTTLLGGKLNGNGANTTIDALLSAALALQPDLLTQNPPLGDVIDLLSAQDAIPAALKPLAERIGADSALSGLPVSAAVALAKTWTGN